MEALIELPRGGEPPGQLREQLVLLVGSWPRRIGSRLAVVIAQVLVATEKPEPVADGGPTQVGCEVAIPRALVAALAAAAVVPDGNRLTREALRLRVVRSVEQESLAALPGDDVDHRPLYVAELGGRADGLHLYFLDEVHAWFGSRDTVARTRRVGAVDQELVLVGAGAKGGNCRHCSARRRSGRHAGRVAERVEHARAPGRDRPQVFRTEPSPEPRITRVDAGRAAVHDHGFNYADGYEHDQPVDCRAGADLDAGLAPGRESCEADLQAVVTGRQGGEAQLPLLV